MRDQSHGRINDSAAAAFATICERRLDMVSVLRAPNNSAEVVCYGSYAQMLTKPSRGRNEKFLRRERRAFVFMIRQPVDRRDGAAGARPSQIPAARQRPLANGAAIPYVNASFREPANPGVHNAAVTASISADDGRANTLVRRGSVLGLTERLI
jgi:hypothetical protein